MSDPPRRRRFALGLSPVFSSPYVGRLRSTRRGAESGLIRRAVAAVETAIALPLLVFLVFGSIEIANGIFLAQALSFASYEGAREASRPGATNINVNDRVAQIMQARGIQDYTVTITPTLTQATQRGTMVTVRVQAAMSALSSYNTGLTGERTTFKDVTMVRN